MNTAIFKPIGNVIMKVVGKAKKNSPEIMIIGGLVGVVTSAVLACRASTKVNDILEETKDTLEIIDKGSEEGQINGKEYTEEDGKKDKRIVYVQTGIKFAKLYGPAVILGALSITGILASNNILRKRNAALGAAYAAVDKSYKEYRKRVIDKFGEEVDKEMRFGIKAKEYTENVVDPETGEVTEVKKTARVIDPNLPSDYAEYFDKRSTAYETNMDYNRMFINAQQAYANNLVQSRGHLFLNEVLDSLGLPRTKAGQIVGWTKNGPDGGYVNFRMMEVDRELPDGRFVPALVLDFNVEGNIWDKL